MRSAMAAALRSVPTQTRHRPGTDPARPEAPPLPPAPPRGRSAAPCPAGGAAQHPLSRSRRILRVGSDSCRSASPTPLPGQSRLEQEIVT
ncbi:taperin-like [Corapipo altera]|uniref:taperin-like n=1 Tax=Corapipo altera TaxID=415028 RepID=UPI000FD685B6|nr:taperin-like [Corapipo altera]